MTQPNKPVSQRAEEPNWLNAETCIENMQIAYEDALEADPFDDGNVIPIDTMVDASDLGVLIGLARYAVANRLASKPTVHMICDDCFSALPDDHSASAIETGTAETVGLGPKAESAAAKPDAQPEGSNV